MRISSLPVSPGAGRGLDPGGVGYVDSYLLDPLGEIVVRRPLHVEHTMVADTPIQDTDLQETPFYRDTRARAIECGRVPAGYLAEALGAAASR